MDPLQLLAQAIDKQTQDIEPILAGMLKTQMDHGDTMQQAIDSLLLTLNTKEDYHPAIEALLLMQEKGMGGIKASLDKQSESMAPINRLAKMFMGEMKGEDGITPKKGKDYWTSQDIDQLTEELVPKITPKAGVDYYTDKEKNDLVNEITKKATPKKGVDYIDGIDGYTPVKGKDYFDGDTPEKGIDYFDGYTPKKGKDYFTADDVNEIVSRATKSATGKATEAVQSTLKKMREEIDGLGRYTSNRSRDAWVGGADTFITLQDAPHNYRGQAGKTLVVNATETALEFATAGGGGGAITSVFGRTGVVVATSGDYTTAQVTESGSLYFTNARAINALTGQSNSIFTNGAGYIASADVQTVTGAKTFNATKLLLRNVADTFNGSFTNTNTADRIYTLQNRAGILADDTDLALKANILTPTFTTNITTPSLIGGTAVGSKITYKSTTGVGTPTGIAHQFVGGTDGATVAMTVLNNGNVGIGTSNPDSPLAVNNTNSSIATLNLTAPNVGNAPWLQFTTAGLNVAQIQNSGGFKFSSFLVGNNNQFVTNNGNFIVFNGSTEYFRVANGGSVGIGTASPSQKLDVAGNIALPTTVDSSTGVIYKGVDRFIHNFALAGTNGQNTFIGVNAGNFTMTGSTGGQGSYNTGEGVSALQNNTTGYQNSAQGASALYSNTTGYYNSAQGVNAGRTIIDGNNNTFVGYGAGYHASQKTNAVNSMALGNGAYTTLDNQVIIGNASVNVGLAQTIPTARFHLPAGAATAGTAPLKFTSGVLNTTAEAGAVEFLTDAYYGTITTGAARKTFAFLEGPVFTTSIQTPTIELGHATDTTLSRSAAGVIAVEGVVIPSISSTDTFTNKRITKRVGTTASSATPTADADAHDMYTVTALAAGATFGAPTGTPTDGQEMWYRVKDNGTARTLAYNAIFRVIGVTLPTTTVISKTLYFKTMYNAADSKWDVLTYGVEA